MNKNLNLPLVAKNLLYLMGKHRMNSTSLAAATKQNQPTIHRIVTGESPDPRSKTLQPLADYFNVSINDLRSINLENGSEINVTQTRDLRGRIPVVSWVQAGHWSEMVELHEIEEWRSTTRNHSNASFALKVKGLSMYNPGNKESFEEGDIILVDPEKTPTNGSLVIARLSESGESTFKKLYEEDGRLILKALNPDWSPQYIELNSPSEITGVVFEKQVDFI